MSRAWFASAAAIALIACSDMGPQGGLEIVALATDLLEGESLSLSVTMDGSPLDPANVEWLSRDRSTLTVDAGVVDAIAPGVAYVIAGWHGVRDSLPVTVRFAHIGADSVGLRLYGDADMRALWPGMAKLQVNVETGSRNAVLMASNELTIVNSQGWAGDSVLFVRSPNGEFQPGTTVIPPGDLTGHPMDVISSSPVKFVFDEHSAYTFFVAVDDARLNITALELPAAPGLVGQLTGWVSFEAAGVHMETTPDGEDIFTPIGDSTVLAYAEFAMPVFHNLSSSASLSLLGGPHAASLLSPSGTARLVDGGLSIVLSGAHPDFQRTGVTATAWLPEPGVGSSELAEVGPEVITEDAGGLLPWAKLFVRRELDDIESHALSRGGTLEVTEYVAPGSGELGTYGLLRGSLHARMRYWDGSFSEDTTIVAGTFSIPVAP